MAIEHLYRLGHRKIAFIKGPKMLADTARRWKGVRGFAHRVGLEIDPHLVVELPDLREATSGFHAGCKAMEALLKARRSFSAVMAFDDMTALGCIRTLMRAGVKVPEQCSVIGFDDVAPAAISTPAITTIRQPMEAMGIAAVEMIGTAIRNTGEHPREPAQRRRLMPELIIRESTSVRA
jgi:LacI family transcriptional regulator